MIELYTPRECADLLRLKTQTLRRWRRIGRGPDYVIIGRRPRYPLASIEKWLANRTRAGEQ